MPTLTHGGRDGHQSRSGRPGRPGRRLAPLTAVTAAATVFAVLLVLVRLQWVPLESVDHGAAADLNSAVAAHKVLVSVIKAITWLGSDGVLWAVTGAGVVLLALRKRWWLAGYLLVAGAGALVMDPVLKSLIGRARPVVAPNSRPMPCSISPMMASSVGKGPSPTRVV